MAPPLLFYQLFLAALVLVCLVMHVWWPDVPRAIPQTPRKPAMPRRKYSQAPHPFLDSSISHYVRPVNRGPKRTPRRRAHHLPSSASPADAGGQSTPDRTSVRLRIVPTMAGSDAATSAPMGIPVAILDGSFSVSPATDTSTKATARSFMANAPRWSSSCASSRVWPKAWASGAQCGCSRSIPIGSKVTAL